ncbi:MAG: DUF6165 family protein [Tepidisphaerales bacterium]
MLSITIKILPGELADRMSIAALRARHLSEGDALRHAQNELADLRRNWASIPGQTPETARLAAELADVNRQLWAVEDELRLCEQRSSFDARFIELARSVYRLNDRRSQLKREINVSLCAAPGEEKVYASRA